MSDRFIPLGKYVPPAPRHPVAHVPKLPQNRKAGDLSFQHVLNRQQLTSAQLKSIPSNSFENAGQKYNLNSQNQIPTSKGQLVISQTGAAQADPGLLKQSSELIDTMPKQMPETSHLEKAMLQNMEDYKTMKTQKSAPQNQSQAGGLKTSFPIPEDNISASQNFSSANSHELSGHSPQTNIQPTIYPSDSTHHSVDNNSKTGAKGQYAFWTDIPEARMKSINSGQRQTIDNGPSRKNSGMHNTSANERVAQSSKSSILDEVKEEESIDKKSDPSGNKGFFSAISSFFGDLASGLTLGFYRPPDEPAPEGIARVVDPFKKLVFDAPIKDLAIGVPVGIYHSTGSMIDGEDETQESKASSSVSESEPKEHSRKYRQRFSLDYS